MAKKARQSKKASPKKQSAKRGASAGGKKPRSQSLPGMEQVRSQRLDNLCESIFDERETMNGAKTEEQGLIQSALQEMQKRGVPLYRHARVELARVPGAEKLRVRVTKEEGDASAEDLEPSDAGQADPTDGGEVEPDARD